MLLQSRPSGSVIVDRISVAVCERVPGVSGSHQCPVIAARIRRQKPPRTRRIIPLVGIIQPSLIPMISSKLRPIIRHRRNSNTPPHTASASPRQSHPTPTGPKAQPAAQQYTCPPAPPHRSEDPTHPAYDSCNAPHTHTSHPQRQVMDRRARRLRLQHALVIRSIRIRLTPRLHNPIINISRIAHR